MAWLTWINVCGALSLLFFVSLVLSVRRIAREVTHAHDWLEVIAEEQKRQTEALRSIERAIERGRP